MSDIIRTSECRVLVVDDMPETLRVLQRLLTIEGYEVVTAASYDEAMHLCDTTRFHVAIVDVRLDANDPSNRDGLRLMQDLKNLDPSTAIIILTSHADMTLAQSLVKPVTNRLNVYQMSPNLAADFIAKSPETLRELNQRVRTVVNDVVGLNWLLDIHDQSGLIDTIPHRLRFVDMPKPPEDQLREEALELLRKLFNEWEKVEVYPLSKQSGGYSKTIVFQVRPWAHGDPGEFAIVKMGQHTLIEQEIIQYRYFVEGRVSNHRSPAVIRPAYRTRSIGGIVYTFIGLGGKIHDFADFYYHTNNSKIIAKVIENLFVETLSLQHSRTGAVQSRRSMRQYYEQKLRLKPDELLTKSGALLTEAGILYKSIKGEKFWLPDGKPIPNPLHHMYTADFNANYFETVIHGDLHTHNVLIDRRLDTWLIDFADTGRGPLLQDYAAFETSLVVEMVECEDRDLLRDWAHALYTADYIVNPPLPAHLKAIPAIAKAHQAVQTVRGLALRERFGFMGEAEKTYLIGLFFTMLRLTTVQFLNPVKRAHALLAAAFIAERLQAIY